MTNFLISGMGGDMAQSIAKIIKAEFPESKIFGIDTSDRNAAKLFCNQFEIGLLANDANYIDYICSFIEKYKIDFFVPCTEHELRVIAKLSEDHILWTKTISCSKNILSVCLDKWETFNFLINHKIKTPWFSDNVESIKNFPCIYKKKTSSGSRDIFKISSPEEAAFITQFSGNSLFQEYLEGDDQEYTCSIFQWDETLEIIQLLRTLTGGSTSWAKVVKIPEIEALCKEIAIVFKLQGSLNVQLRLTVNGPMIFEINPRFSSTVYMRDLVGFKDFVWSVKKMQGEKLHAISSVPAGKEIVKISDIIIF